MAAKKRKKQARSLVDAATNAAIEVGLAAESLQASMEHMSKAKTKARPVTTAAKRAGSSVIRAAKKAGRTVASATRRTGSAISRTAKAAMPGSKKRTTSSRSRSR